MKKIMLLFILIAIASYPLSGAAADYHALKEVMIGGAGGFDYLSVDPDAHRLYVTHGTSIAVIDTEKDTLVGSITNVPGVHGFAIAAELGRGFSSNGRENKVSIVDLKTLATISKTDTGANPDAIMFEPSAQEVYAFNHSGSSATVIDAKTGKSVATIPLSGTVETGVADSKAGQVYVNIEDKNQIAVIDIKEHKVVGNWPLAPGDAPTGLAIDLEHHRLFAGCNQLLVMVDSTNGKVVSTLPIGAGVDATAFDAQTGLVFASCGGSGTVAIARVESDKLTAVQTLTTARGARTMTIDPKTHKIYLASGQGAAFKVMSFGM